MLIIFCYWTFCCHSIEFQTNWDPLVVFQISMYPYWLPKKENLQMPIKLFTNCNISDTVLLWCQNVSYLPLLNTQVWRFALWAATERMQLLLAKWHQPGGQSGLSSHIAYLHLNCCLGHPRGISLLVQYFLQLSKDVLGHPSHGPTSIVFIVALVQDFDDNSS